MRKIPTHIDGLDETLGGGIPEQSVVLVVGAAGAMKSSLAFAILYQNAIRGNKGLYISLEQGRASLLEHAETMGMKIENVHESMSVLDLATLRKRREEEEGAAWLDYLKMYTESVRQNFAYDLLALDSLDALEILAKFQNIRADVFELFKWLRSLKCTSLVIAELPEHVSVHAGSRGYRAFAKHREDYLADGVIHLMMEKRGDFEVQRRLRVVKMRGARHATAYHALVFDNGLKVTRVMS